MIQNSLKNSFGNFFFFQIFAKIEIEIAYLTAILKG